MLYITIYIVKFEGGQTSTRGGECPPPRPTPKKKPWNGNTLYVLSKNTGIYDTELNYIIPL